MDWAAAVGNVLDACGAVFGESVEYSYNGGAAISIRGVFDSAHIAVDPDTGASISTTDPLLGIKAADLPGKPTKSDTVTVHGIAYRVIDSQPDGQGGINLILKKL